MRSLSKLDITYIIMERNTILKLRAVVLFLKEKYKMINEARVIKSLSIYTTILKKARLSSNSITVAEKTKDHMRIINIKQTATTSIKS
ncbi:hypothetical protein J2Z35_000941 [Acetoanaerobium pronyense]|uniref:Uncharacterized protein n=1 Tax=Acetoanaerobium pronyense TaxID=1482736 RepID=A0ABS4KH82_9FIRM|nr:hypothetical protein [Acetoanaerobium pronyense]